MTKTTSNTPYREIALPGGTFRQYEDRPYVWVQILQPGEKSFVNKIELAYASGSLKGKK